MAQVGRISGPLLEANLERNGIDLAFRNDLSTTELLYLDVNNGRIAVNKDVAVSELDVTDGGTLGTTNLIVPNAAPIANFTIENNEINVLSGDITLDAAEAIVLNNLDTEQFTLKDNTISTKNSNANIDLVTNGTGSVEVVGNVNVYGNLTATGDITLDGTLTFGDAVSEDTVEFNTDVNSDIVPAPDSGAYNLGKPGKRWGEFNTNLINSQSVIVNNYTAGGVTIDQKQGNIFFVSQNGSDTEGTGEHPQSPFRTLKHALSAADASIQGPVVIFVYPGEYQEETPLVVPTNVAVIGNDMRNTVIIPDSATQSEDVFHLNGETTIENITIKDFFYDSINDKGYALRFAPNTTITSRSPYIKNITVITQGSSTPTEDPRGFNAGDAGKGVLVDGADVLSASQEASMLFHSVTLITPGVDALTMTNGVRVEWLNSFTYYANRGLYAVDGVTGHLSTDGSTVKYGAELRSIGSANIYGNYGAVADGSDTLMYLIQHNFSYIGAGKYTDNDPSRAIENNQIVELNSGVIHYQTTDQLGKYRVGDNFFIDFETGETSLNIDDLVAEGFTGIRVNTGNKVSRVTPTTVETGNIQFINNLLESLAGDLNIGSATGKINLNDNVSILDDLTISGDLSFDGTLNLLGNQSTDLVTLNVNLDQDFNPHETLEFSLGTPIKKWKSLNISQAEISDISISDNIVQTNVSNANLELRASGTGIVYLPDSMSITNNLDVTGSTTLEELDINGSFTTAGAFGLGSQFESESTNVAQNLTVDASAQFEEVNISGNVITTTSSNSNLELLANGSGNIVLQENVDTLNNILAGSIQINNDTNVTKQTSFALADVSDVTVSQNYITSNRSNANLEIRASGTGNINILENNFKIENALVINSNSTIQNITVTGNLLQTGNRTQTGNLDIAGEISNGNILIEDNFITTTESNSDLELRANGTGELLVPNNNLQIDNNLTVSTDTDLQGTTITGSLTHVGDTTHTGNITQGGELTVDNVYIEDNFITTTSGNLILETFDNSSVAGLITLEVELTRENPVGSGIYDQPDETTVFILTDFEQARADVVDVEVLSPTRVRLTLDNKTGTWVEGRNLRYNNGGPFQSIFGKYYAANESIIELNKIKVSTNDVEIAQDLTVSGLTSLQNTIITGLLTHTGDRTQTGNYDIAGEISNGNILIEDNFITTNSNSDLELRANGTGELLIPNNNVQIVNDLSISSNTDLQNTTITGSITHIGNVVQTGNFEIAGEITNGNILIEDNFITTTNTNSDLELRANGTGSVVIDADDPVTIENNLTVSGTLFYSGALTIDGDVLVGPSTQDGSLTVGNDFVIDGQLEVGALAQFEELRFENNVITITTSNADLELRANGTGSVVLQEDATFNNNLIVGQTVTSNNLNIEQTVTSNIFDNSKIEITNNTFTQKDTNLDFELRANSTGDINLNSSLVIDNDLTVNSTTDTQNVEITGTVTQTGNTVQTGNSTITGDVSVLGNFVSDRSFDFDRFIFNDNIITTKDNDNFILKAAGTGSVLFNDGLVIGGNLSADVINSDTVYIDDSVSLEILEGSTDVTMFDNVITTTLSNSDLELRTNGTGLITFDDFAFNQTTLTSINDITLQTDNLDINANTGLVVPTGTTAENQNLQGSIRLNLDDNVFEGYNTSRIGFGGVYSSDRLTKMIVNNSDDIQIFVDGYTEDSTAQVGDVSGNRLRIHGLQVDDINFDDNVISTNVSNSNLELTPNNNGIITVDDLNVSGNTITNTLSDTTLKIGGTGQQWVVFEGDHAVKFPSGDTSARPASAVLGQTRHNTDTNELETWIGNQWRTSAGEFASISEAQMEEEAFIQTLIYG